MWLLRLSAKIHHALYKAKSFPEYTSILIQGAEDVELGGTTTITGGASYAVANATWTRASGHGSTVTANPASDPIGTLTGGSAITIVLPRTNADKDPNVYSGDILQYVTIGGTNYAVGESYLDEKIGSVKLYTNADIPHGWALMESSGQGHDMTGYFPLGTAIEAEIFTDGGGDDHYHNVRDTTVSVAAGGDYDVTSAAVCPSGPLLREDAICDLGTADIRGPWVKFFYLIRIAPNGAVV